MSKLTLRRVTPEELPLLEKLCYENFFQIGLHNREILTETTKCFNYFVINESGEVVGFRVAHLVTPEIVHKYLANVQKRYRGNFHKIEKQVDDDLVANGWHGSVQYFLANDISLRIMRHYKDMIVGPKVHYHLGKLDRSQLAIPSPIPGIKIGVVENEMDLKIAKSYDRKIYKYGREKFTDVWFRNSDRKWTCFAIDEDKQECVGLATVAEHFKPSLYFINPVYAESADIALAMLTTLLLQLPPNVTEVGAYVPVQNKTMLSFARKVGMKGIEKAEMIMYMKAAVEVPWEKVYAIHEYFPC